MLSIALINGSPKAKDSASGCLLEEMKGLLKESMITEYRFQKPGLLNPKEVLEHDVLVFSFPLYVDGIPSHLLYCLKELAKHRREHRAELTVYAICNAGFYEGHQNQNALQMLKNWCVKCQMTWGGGIGIGGGGMVQGMKNVPHGKGPKKNSSAALDVLADNILSGGCGENIYVNPGIPRFLYKLAAELGWKQVAKANGLKKKDLSMRR
jgi:hypothetical protein